MNRRNANKRRTTIKKVAKTRKPSGSAISISGLKQKVNLVVIWGLVVINAVLISSFIHKIVTPTQTPMGASVLPIADPIKVQVLNGCGKSGIANEFADLLQRKKYDVVEIGNATTWDYQKTVIINRDRRDKKQVDEFRDLIGISKELVYPIKNDEVEYDITLILGYDYDTLKSYKSLH